MNPFASQPLCRLCGQPPQNREIVFRRRFGWQHVACPEPGAPRPAASATHKANLSAAMLARAGDLAHDMLRKGLRVHMARGKTPNGRDCTVIYAIDADAPVLEQVGDEMIRRVEADAAAAKLRAERG